MNLRFFSLILATVACIALGRHAFAQAGNDNPGGVTSDFHGSITTAGYYDPYTGNARREITDIVVPGSIGAYPLKYTRTYNTRGLGGWSNNFAWSLTRYGPYFDPGGCGTDIEYCDTLGKIIYPGGSSFDLMEPVDAGIWPLSGANGRNGPVDRLFDCAKAESQCTPGARFELRRADGGKVLFQAPPNAHTFKAYAIIDPFGQATTLAYNASGNLWKVTEPGGRYLELLYTNGLSAVRADDGRGNTIETVRYSVPGLTKAYYDDGSEATYTYAQYMNSAGQMYGVLDTCDDPRYAGPMKFIKYDYVQVSEGGQFFTMGQVKAERNVAGQVVSQITFPTSYSDPNLLIRTETRGDGFSRTFDYRGGGGQFTWTDFKNKTWTDTQDYASNSWTVTDPRGNATKYEREGVVDAVWRITYPATADNGSTTREFTFTNSSRPYFHSGVKDENDHWTLFDRDQNNRVKKITYPDNSTEEFLSYNNFGQVRTRRLTNGYYEHFFHDERGLLLKKWSPTSSAAWPPPDSAPHVTFTYYPAGHPWADRVQTKISPPNAQGLVATETTNTTEPWFTMAISRSPSTRAIHVAGVDSLPASSMPTGSTKRSAMIAGGTRSGRKTSCVTEQSLPTINMAVSLRSPIRWARRPKVGTASMPTG